MEDNQSLYSGTSGGFASLVSQPIDYFQIGIHLIYHTNNIIGRNDDNHSMKLAEESGESGDSDDTNSMHVENESDHEYAIFVYPNSNYSTINEVSYS